LARLCFFAQARDCAGTSEARFNGVTVGDVLDAAVARYGTGLDAVIAFSAVWLNGEPASREMPVGDSDEVAVLPPVSGG
jgi:molybdopterin converting factor small subunit